MRRSAFVNVPVFSRKLDPGKSTCAKREVTFSKMSWTTSSSSDESAFSTWCTLGSVCAMSSPKTYIARSPPAIALSNICGIISPFSLRMGLPQRASNASRTASSPVERYIVRYVGSAPTSLEPCTLF